jgi:hypothetical protein
LPAFVKTKRDEKLWDKAKRIVEEEYGRSESDGDRFYRLATSIFKRMKKSLGPRLVLDLAKSESDY